MTVTIIGKPLAARTVLTLLIASSTVWADPRATSNIPEAPPFAADETNSPSSQPIATPELPLPYGAWSGTGPQPPTLRPAADTPPPLARARELPRRPFELTASLTALLPSCGTGSVDDRGCLTVAPGSGVEVALLYRPGPFFALGLEGIVGNFGERGAGSWSRSGGGARFFGVVGRVYFADQGAWDPYVALTLGAGTLGLRGPIADAADARLSTSGLGGRVAGGLDYVFGTHFRLGPTASFAHWVAWSEQSCAAGVCRDQPAMYGRMLGFASLGFRLTGSFGDVL